MFSVLFPGQGSQSVGMVKDLYSKFNTVRDLFSKADDTLKFSPPAYCPDSPGRSLSSIYALGALSYIYALDVRVRQRRERVDVGDVGQKSERVDVGQ